MQLVTPRALGLLHCKRILLCCAVNDEISEHARDVLCGFHNHSHDLPMHEAQSKGVSSTS
eukprot:701452-Pleurochrysis_carterae.AAC.1